MDSQNTESNYPRSNESNTRGVGWPLISLAAMLWGSDTLLRPIVQKAGLSSSAIVLFEHIVLVLIFLPFLIRHYPEWKKLTLPQWGALAFLGMLGSGLATVLITQAYMSGSPYMAALLQKTQPIFTIILAGIFLKERRKPVFWLFYAGAIVATYLLAFGFSGVHDAFLSPKFSSVCYALGAAAIWGTCTVVGRAISNDVAPTALAGLRFAFAIPFLIGLFIWSGVGSVTFSFTTIVLPMALIILLPDALGMFLYYQGLKRTPASIATLAELAFPATALLIGFGFQGAKFDVGQWTGLILLLSCIHFIQSTKSVRTAASTPVASTV